MKQATTCEGMGQVKLTKTVLNLVQPLLDRTGIPLRSGDVGCRFRYGLKTMFVSFLCLACLTSLNLRPQERLTRYSVQSGGLTFPSKRLDHVYGWPYVFWTKSASNISNKPRYGSTLEFSLLPLIKNILCFSAVVFVSLIGFVSRKKPWQTLITIVQAAIAIAFVFFVIVLGNYCYASWRDHHKIQHDREMIERLNKVKSRLLRPLHIPHENTNFDRVSYMKTLASSEELLAKLDWFADGFNLSDQQREEAIWFLSSNSQVLRDALLESSQHLSPAQKNKLLKLPVSKR